MVKVLKKVEIIYLGLGSNLGDRLGSLETAVKALSLMPFSRFMRRSTWLENPAVGDAAPNDFLNGVVELKTSLSPLELLAEIRHIESTIDPERNNRGRKLARKIDIDILLYGDLVLETEDLVIPHPRMTERDFVMKPLLELVPSLQKIVRHCEPEAKQSI